MFGRGCMMKNGVILYKAGLDYGYGAFWVGPVADLAVEKPFGQSKGACRASRSVLQWGLRRSHWYDASGTSGKGEHEEREW